MTRVIKFRAWDKENKKWIEPDSFFVMGNGDLGSYGSYDDTGGFMHEPVLMQFTGLLDKNGKDCYEGDIISYQERGEKRAEVKWVGRGFWLVEEGEELYWPNEFEVVGNIYENER